MSSFQLRVAEQIVNDAHSGSAAWDELNGPSAELHQEDGSFVIEIPQEYDDDGAPSGDACVITVEHRKFSSRGES